MKSRRNSKSFTAPDNVLDLKDMKTFAQPHIALALGIGLCEPVLQRHGCGESDRNSEAVRKLRFGQ